MTLGALAVTVGVPAAYYLLDGNASRGPLHRSARDCRRARCSSWPVTLWKARRTDGSRRRRYLRRALIVVATPVLAWAIVWFIVFPIGFAYIYVHTGRSAVTPDLGVPYETVTVVTDDSLNLAASYVPSRNRAAVVLFPGATRSREARMLIRHGYGVLLLDPRGQGSSEGDTVRWAGDRDLLAAAEYLRHRPDVDPGRIGGFGFSIGGEILIEAAAQSTAFKAIVTEGAGSRVGDEDVTGPARLLAEPNLALMTAALTRLLEPRPAAADRESHRADRTPLGLPDPRRPRPGRREHARPDLLRSGRRAKADLEGARLKTHRRHTALAPTSTSVGSSTSSTTPFSTRTGR